MRLAGACALAVLGLLSHAGSAEPPPDSPEQAAATALAACRRGDAEALKSLAAKDSPDPWTVADELLALGERDTALVFAKAAPVPKEKGLAEYVIGLLGTAPDAEAHAALAAGSAALSAGDHARALEILSRAPAVASPVTMIRFLHARGRALRALGRLEESTTAFDAAADSARGIGWGRRESMALGEAATSAFHRSDWGTALDRFGRMRAICEQRGDRVGAARALANLGSVHRSRGEIGEALSCLERALAIHEEVGDRAGAAAALGNIGLVHDGLGKYRDALAFLQRSLEIRESLADREGIAATLGNIGSIHYRLGDLPKALDFYERALALSEQAADRSEVARTLGNIGNVHWKRGNYDEALSFQERSLALREEIGDRAGAATTLGNIGLIHECCGRYDEALTFQERSLAICEEIGDRAGMAAALGNIGNLHWQRGDFARAASCQERSLRLSEEIGDQARVAWMLANIGSRCTSVGDFAMALSWQERALALSGEIGDRFGVASVLTAIGFTHLALGDSPKALAALQRSLALMEEIGDRAGVASALGSIGIFHKNLGDYAKALVCMERSLAMAESIGDRAAVAAALIGLANVYDRLGDFPKALSFSQRSLSLMEESGDRAGAAALLGNIGSLHASLGDFKTARAHLTRSLELLDDLGDRAGVARTLANIGALASRVGDFELTMSLAERSLAICEEMGNRVGAAMARFSIGLAHEGLGNIPMALSTLERAAREMQRLRLSADHASVLSALSRTRLAAGDAGRALVTAKQGVLVLERMLGGLAEEEASTARGVHASLYAAGALAAARLGETAEVVGFLESGRAGTLLETLGGRQALSWQDLPQDLALAQAGAKARVARAKADYSLAMKGGERAAVSRAAQALDDAVDLECEVVSRIQREAKRTAGLLYPRVAPMEEIQGWLEPGEVLVLYGLCLGESLAVVLTFDSDTTVPLGPAAGIAEGDSAAMRARLVAPLSLPETAKRVLVSPEGELCCVPWSTLFDLPVACVPSGTTLALLRDEVREPGRRVLALGDPDYSDPDTAAAAIYRGKRPTPLPGSGQEARAVGDVVLTGAEASEPAFAAALAKEKRWRAVHFACHGLVRPEKPTLSSLALARAGDTDGFLTCLEVLRARIPADLAVLSACETARGRIVQGEGIVGLARAFMYAGTPRVLCSLWQVDDAATRALMLKFYELWNPKEGDGLSAAEALRRAQDFIRAQGGWEDPLYWAAWQLWGLPE